MIAGRLLQLMRRSHSPLHPKFNAATWPGSSRATGTYIPLERMLSDESDQIMAYYLLRTKMWPVNPAGLQPMQPFDVDDEK